jgi:uncharacterized membrane protein
MSNLDNFHTCGLGEVSIFLLALISGTVCSVCSKVMMSMEGTDGTHEEDGSIQIESFQILHIVIINNLISCLYWLSTYSAVSKVCNVRRNAIWTCFPLAGNTMQATVSRVSFDPEEEICKADIPEIVVVEPQQKNAHRNKAYKAETSTWVYFFLAVPTMFDLIGIALCLKVKGLEYLDVSMYQMLCGSCIVFVALMKRNILKDRLQRFHWIGECSMFVTYLLSTTYHFTESF